MVVYEFISYYELFKSNKGIMKNWEEVRLSKVDDNQMLMITKVTFVFIYILQHFWHSFNTIMRNCEEVRIWFVVAVIRKPCH